MDESGIDLDFDLDKYINGDINYDELFQQSEHILCSQDQELPYYELKSRMVDSSR